MAEQDWPRRLLSPKGVRFFIRDEAALHALCQEAENKSIDMRFNNMMALLGKAMGSSARQQYKYGWQDFDCVRWLTHPGLAVPLPVVEQPDEFFSVFKQRPDAMDLSESDRKAFVTFVNGNVRRSQNRNKVKVPIGEARLGAAMWRVVFKPDGAETFVPTMPQGTPYADPAAPGMVSCCSVRVHLFRLHAITAATVPLLAQVPLAEQRVFDAPVAGVSGGGVAGGQHGAVPQVSCRGGFERSRRSLCLLP
jgi:hypothetical protein|eukprot:1568646-Prymnesium_polylepis.2